MTQYVYRLTVPYAFMIIFTVGIMPVLGNGPRWSEAVDQFEYCNENWWTNLLYINNWIHPVSVY